jgi:hypothetical protein
MHYIYGIGQPCLTLWTNCMKVTYDNYSTTKIMKHSLTTILQLLDIGSLCNYPTTNYNIIIIILLLYIVFEF